MDTFTIDLQRGEVIEMNVLSIIKKKYPKAYKVDGYFKDYDLYIPEINKSIEVKSDEKSKYTGKKIIKTDFEKDHKYCIDAEIVKDGYIMLGIQIKPISYKMMSTVYQNKAKANHKEKNENYARMYAPYLYVYYDGDDIVDKEETINKINTIMHLNI